MEELMVIAKAYYQASSDHHQQLARDFFGAMDHDGDGKIDQKEFIEFLISEGYAQMTRPSFFKQLDLDGNGTLDFFEVMTLYYILKSGRPFCDKCNMFIPNTYFTCAGCLEEGSGVSLHLCLQCYTAQKCDHAHNGLSRYVDNYSLLDVMLKSNLSTARSRPSSLNTQAWNSPSASDNQHSWSQCPPTAPLQNSHSGNNHAWNQSLAMVPVPNSSPPIPTHHSWSQCPQTAPLQNSHSGNNHTWNQSLAMVPVPNSSPPIPTHHSWSQCPPTAPLQNVAPFVYHHTYIQNNYSYNHTPPHLVQTPPAAANAIVPQRQGWKIAFEALETALYVGAIGSNLCSIL
ncbi:hypothetical protein OSB04_026563 [Centaurea solstitialis]|uniref:EF-hand domain-containing protein n=1 Tax=Centaurea solstitialis TaxID=347529 RepID=A0AA38SVM9_9ASTR|nr:hypothetical protein OSB04_026563 [Centaurea solstitialis]